MNIQGFFERLDRLFQEKRIEDAGCWIVQSRQEAEAEEDLQSLLAILNEEIGYARSRGEHDRSRGAFADAEQLMRRMALPESPAMATTLLNGATAYRAAGDFKKAMELYREAERVYRVCGIQGTYENASLFNNMSILYDQMEMYEEAVSCLEKAREIIKTFPDCQGELATTDTNMGLIYLRHGQKEEGMKMLNRAKQLFDSLDGEDAHYWSALGGLAQAYYMVGNYEDSISMYEKAIDSVERNFGKNDAFRVLCDNCIFVCETVGDKDLADKFSKRKIGL